MAKRKKYRPRSEERDVKEALRKFIQNGRAKSNFTYGQLADALRENGLTETEHSVRHKLRRGTFSATFLLFTLQALGIWLIPWKELGMPGQEGKPRKDLTSRAERKLNQKIKDARDLYSRDMLRWTTTVQPRNPYGR